MEFRLPSGSDDGYPPEPISVGAGIGLAVFASLLGSAALFQIFYGLFALRTLRLLLGLAMAGGGGYLLVWVARRGAEEWRLSLAGTSLLAGFYYCWKASIANDILAQRFRGLASSHMYGEHTGAAFTALVLFIVAGFALVLHIRSAR